MRVIEGFVACIVQLIVLNIFILWPKNWSKPVVSPQKTDVDWSTSVQSSLFAILKIEGPVTVLVHGPWGQKTGPDWTSKH